MPDHMREVDVLLPIGPGEQAFAGAALESVLQSRGISFRVRIILDGRNGPPESVPRDLLKGNLVDVVENSSGRGVARAMNFGLSLCQSPYVAVMHSDDICHPDRLRIEFAVLERYPDAVAVGALAVTFVGDPPPPLLPVPPEPTVSVVTSAELLSHNPFIDPTTMFRAAAISAARGYRSEMTSMQDYELLLRLGTMGDLIRVDAPLLQYRLHDGQFSRKRRKSSEWGDLWKARRRLALERLGASWRGDLAHMSDLRSQVIASSRYRSAILKERVLRSHPRA